MLHPITLKAAGGEYMDSVLVLEWCVKLGEKLAQGDTVVVVETAKAATEVLAPHDGYLVDTCFAPGQEAPVGAVLGHIGEAADTHASAQGVSAVQKPLVVTTDAAWARAPASDAAGCDRTIATPLARRVAKASGVDLWTVRGTGPGGRIKARDVEVATTATRQRTPAVETSMPTSPNARHTHAPIVLLHGFGADRSTWRWVAPLLGSGVRILTPELPGHGNAPALDVARIDDIASVIEDELHAQGIEEIHLVGHSLGGAAALTLAQTGRLRIRSLCLIAPAGLGSDINLAFLNGLTQARQADTLRDWFAQMVADPALLPDGFAEAVLRQRACGNTQVAQTKMLQALFPDGVQTTTLTAALDAVQVPTKLVWGLKDTIIPAAHAASAPGHVARHLLRDVGHVPQWEAPALVARLIRELVCANP